MLAEIYIEALLVDEGLADQVWELWNAGIIPDEIAVWAWWLVATRRAGLSNPRTLISRPHRHLRPHRLNCYLITS